MFGLGDGAFLKFDAERAAGFGFEDGKQGGRLGEAEKFLLFLGRQGILLIPHGQVVHPGGASLCADRDQGCSAPDPRGSCRRSLPRMRARIETSVSPAWVVAAIY